MAKASTATKPSSARRRRPIGLAALRGFECAARRLSFTLAAAELALTQSSISRQISSLERQVGKALFVRKTRALALTPAGARLLAVVAPALGQVDRAVDEIRGLHQVPRVSLTTYASFASLWLVPRLAEFQRDHPGVEIRIDANDRRVDLAAEGIDIAVRRCPPAHMADTEGARLLCEERVMPALSPNLYERERARLREPVDLKHLTLIDLADPLPAARASTWQRWFESNGLPPDPGSGGRMSFSFIDQAVQSAVRGQGVVLGRTPFLADSVADGLLTAPFPDLAMPTGYSYYLIVNPERAEVPDVADFAHWLIAEFERGPRRPT